MLKKLFIQNFALIDRLEIDFHSGFTVLTGETGAGKSIIIDAVGLVIGEQGLTEYIRSGEDKALVEAVFEIAGNERVTNLLGQYGYLPDEGEYLIISRELVKSGKNLCRINGRPVNLSLLKEISRCLIDIYGQHHQQSLLDPQKHIGLLDGFGGPELAAVKENVASAWERLEALSNQVRQLESSEVDQARMMDLYRFQVDEIDRLRLLPEEDLQLEEERNILINSERLAVLSAEAYDYLYNGGKFKPVSELLGDVLTRLRELKSIDEKISSVYDVAESALYQLEEAARELKSYNEGIEADPVRLEELDARLNQIKTLQKKYGKNIREILEYREQAAAALEAADNYELELDKLIKEKNEAERKYMQTAGQLSRIRKEKAEQLKQQITKELQELNIPNVSFDLKFSVRTSPGVQGADDMEFLISPNKGEPPKPLARIASGGEMSRIMLAFKAILANSDSVSTFIFDEVDAGIGGKTLDSVAQKLSALGIDRQVVCVTHSPQIAGVAENHFSIVKNTADERTVTTISRLDHHGRTDEIARMLAGGSITPVARKHAEEILKRN